MRRALLSAVTLLLLGCDPGAEVGFAPVEPLPTPEPTAQPGLWWPADPDDVGPDTRMLDVLVLEQACAGGEPAHGRIRAPLVSSDEHTVVVTFVVDPAERAATCPSNPPTPAVLELDEPLGGRILLDGGSDPPREPTPEP